LRFRKDLRIRVTGGWTRPDIVFRGERVAVFVDGCFWHRCPDHGRMPNANRSYWEPKLTGNVQRDLRNNRELAAAGWLVLRFFEHVPSTEAAARVHQVVTARRLAR
jgi:DNA mismatch endonuclease (patch repair protein)